MKIIRIILLVLVVFIFYSSTSKVNQMKKSFKLKDDSFVQANSYEHPANILEPVQSDTSDTPQIKIRLVSANDDDDNDATISMDTESESESDEEEEEGKQEAVKRNRVPKSKLDDIHSFL